MGGKKEYIGLYTVYIYIFKYIFGDDIYLVLFDHFPKYLCHLFIFFFLDNFENQNILFYIQIGLAALLAISFTINILLCCLRKCKHSYECNFIFLNQIYCKLFSFFLPCMYEQWPSSLLKRNSLTVTSLFITARKSQQIQTTDEDDNDVSINKVIKNETELMPLIKHP